MRVNQVYLLADRQLINWQKRSICPHHTSNSSGDEIANVNFLYDDAIHALQKNRLVRKYCHRSTRLCLATQVYQIQWNHAPTEGFPWDDLHKIFAWMSMGGQSTKWLETVPKISIAWVGCTNVTDDRQTDDRQTDVRWHSERELTWAKNRYLQVVFIVKLLKLLRSISRLHWIRIGSCIVLRRYEAIYGESLCLLMPALSVTLLAQRRWIKFTILR